MSNQSTVEEPKLTTWDKIKYVVLVVIAVIALLLGAIKLVQGVVTVWTSPVRDDIAVIESLGVEDVRWMQTFYSGKVGECGEFAIMINSELKEVTFFTEEGDWQEGTHWDPFATLPLDGSTTVENDPTFVEC